jgi:hypothetical protein
VAKWVTLALFAGGGHIVRWDSWEDLARQIDSASPESL